MAIARRHLLEDVPICDLSDEYEISPTVFHRGQKQLFEQGAAAYRRYSDAALPLTQRAKHLTDKYCSAQPVLRRVYSRFT